MGFWSYGRKKNKKILYVFLGQNFIEVQIWYGGMGSSLFYNRQGINGEDHKNTLFLVY